MENDLILLQKNGAGSWIERILQPAPGQVILFDGDGLPIAAPVPASAPAAHAATHLPAGTDPIAWGTVNNHGLIASRPAPSASVANTWYFATDVTGGQLYFCDGSAWVQVGLPNGYTPPPISAMNSVRITALPASALQPGILYETKLAAPGPVALTLTQGTVGNERRLLYVRDSTGDADVNNITITPFAGQTFQGLDNLIIAQKFGSVALYYVQADSAWYQLSTGALV